MLEIINEQEVLGYPLRVYGTLDSPLFLAKDVAGWLEYGDNTGAMLASVDEDEKQIASVYRAGQSREMWFLTKDGLYEVLMHSRKPTAQLFKKQVKAILKEGRKQGVYSTDTLSPQLQLLINMEREQKRLSTALDETNQRIEDIREVVALDSCSWREDSKKITVQLAQALGGEEYIKDVQREIYRQLELRTGARLSIRLTNKRRRMADEGVCISKRNNLSKLDVIADDKKLIEIYGAIVKELAISKGVSVETLGGCSSVGRVRTYAHEMGELRILEIDGEPWFVGKDVADILGYRHTNKAIADHVDEEDRITMDRKKLDTFGLYLGQRGGWLINESGLYSLIIRSKLPTAKDFKRWVTSEVLPHYP